MDQIILATTYSPFSRDINSIVHKHWHILPSDVAFGQNGHIPYLFAHDRFKYLRNELVRARLPPVGLLHLILVISHVGIASIAIA